MIVQRIVRRIIAEHYDAFIKRVTDIVNTQIKGELVCITYPEPDIAIITYRKEKK